MKISLMQELKVYRRLWSQQNITRMNKWMHKQMYLHRDRAKKVKRVRRANQPGLPPRNNKRKKRNRKQMIYWNLLTNLTTISSWKTKKLSQHLKSLKIEFRKSKRIKSGKRIWPNNGMMMLIKQVIHRKFKPNHRQIDRVYIHTVSQSSFYISLIIFNVGSTKSKTSYMKQVKEAK